MSKKQLGQDKFGVQKVMHFGDYFGDSLGMFALNAISGLVGHLLILCHYRNFLSLFPCALRFLCESAAISPPDQICMS